jgi:dTDP-4-amino-4,6-dideoxygalactose transaminase
MMTPAPVELGPELLGMPKEFQVLPSLRGREALFVLLKSLAFPPGTGIGVPLFVCSCVPHTVREAGFTPVFIDTCQDDFGPDLSDMAKKAPRVAAVIMVYTLGRPIDIEAVRKILPDKVLIEDCAHAMGSSYRGRALGTLGDAAFFTFGFFKPVPAGGGGAIVVRDRQIAERARALLLHSQAATPGSHLRHSLICLAKGTAFRNPAYSLFARMRPEPAEERQSALSNSRCIYGPLQMRPGDYAVIRRYLRLDRRDQCEMDGFWYELRSRIPEGWHLPSEPAYGTWNHFMFGIRSPAAEHCAKAVKRLRAAGISVARLFPNCRMEMETAGYAGDCPSSECLASLAFTIPVHRALSASQRKKILRVVPQILRVS